MKLLIDTEAKEITFYDPIPLDEFLNWVNDNIQIDIDEWEIIPYKPQGLEEETRVGNPCMITKNSSGYYHWQTNEYHHNNTQTMQDFLENHLVEEYKMILDEGNYVEIKIGPCVYGIWAYGGGDSFTHIAKWVILTIDL